MPLNIKILIYRKFIDYSFLGKLASLRESENKYRQQHIEASHREKILVRRLASKEQELQEYIVRKYPQMHSNLNTIRILLKTVYHYMKYICFIFS